MEPLTAEEIILLRRIAGAPEKSWWPNYPFIVSVMAFLLSLSTSLVAIYTSHRRDINDQLTQLSNSIQTIQDLNLKQVETYEKYKGTPYAAQAGGLISTQVNITLNRATDLAFSLGTNASTAALATVGSGLFGLGDLVKSRQLFELALQAARSANDESLALRDLGFVTIRSAGSGNSLQAGEELFFRATNLERKWNLSPQPREPIVWLKASAYAQWAGALAPTNCEEARKRFAEAAGILDKSLQGIDIAQLRENMQAQEISGIGGVGNCRPTVPASISPAR